MTITLLRDGRAEISQDPLFEKVSHLDCTFEWIGGQYWLHSDNPKERPIGIQVDQELNRHQDYFKKSSLQKELLAKAVGVKGPLRPRVLDLSAGLLGDSLLLLSFGCEVTAIERHPVVSFLIQSSLANAHDAKLKKFHFHAEDAKQYLANAKESDVIYFDPMFEDANHKASPRKEMRIFRNFVGPDQDALEIFKLAIELRPRRLVVKRPRQSVTLGPQPSLQFIGKSTRYDVYFSI